MVLFVLLWKKRNSGAKNGTLVQEHTVPFFAPLWKKRNSGAKNGTVVQKHTVPFFVLLWKKRNRSAKNGTVVQKHTVPLWKKRNSGAKNGTVPWGCLRFVIAVFPDITRFLFLQKRNSDTKTHSVSFCSVVSCEKN